MCLHIHADLNFSAFSIKEFFGSKPVNDIKMHLNLSFSVKISWSRDKLKFLCIADLNFSAFDVIDRLWSEKLRDRKRTKISVRMHMPTHDKSSSEYSLH